MGRGIADLITALYILLPGPIVWIVLFGVMLAMLPGLRFAMRSKQIRGLIRRRVRATPSESKRLANQALSLAAGHGPLLIALGRESIRMHQRDLWNRTKVELEKLPRFAKELDELQKTIQREAQPLLHPIEVLSTVNRLLDLGMLDAAEARLGEALARFPKDQELIAAQQSLLERQTQSQNQTPNHSTPNRDE